MRVVAAELQRAVDEVPSRALGHDPAGLGAPGERDVVDRVDERGTDGRSVTCDNLEQVVRETRDLQQLAERARRTASSSRRV